MAARRKKTKRPDMRVRFRDDPPVETDLRFWLEHVLHWHALLFAVTSLFYIGYVLF